MKLDKDKLLLSLRRCANNFLHLNHTKRKQSISTNVIIEAVDARKSSTIIKESESDQNLLDMPPLTSIKIEASVNEIEVKSQIVDIKSISDQRPHQLR